MSHFDKVVFALRSNEFSLPANETCEKLVSLAGNKNSLILSAKTTLSKWLIEAERKGREGKGKERQGKEEGGKKEGKKEGKRKGKEEERRRKGKLAVPPLGGNNLQKTLENLKLQLLTDVLMS